VKWSDGSNETQERDRETARAAAFEPLPAWRLTEHQLRKLAEARPRRHEGEVTWVADAD